MRTFFQPGQHRGEMAYHAHMIAGLQGQLIKDIAGLEGFFFGSGYGIGRCQGHGGFNVVGGIQAG